MSLGISGQYVLSVKFGDQEIPVNASNLKQCTVIQDIRKLLPEFRFIMKDTSGILSHVMPFDKKMSRLSFKISTAVEDPKMDFYDFTVYRRELVADGLANGDYDIRGLLDVEGLHSPNWIRSFNGTVTSTIQQLGAELGITKYEISSSLNIKKTIIQPNWTNGQLLKYMANTLTASNLEANFRVFVKVVNNTKILVFKSLRDLINAPLKAKYIFSDKLFEDYKPAYNYEILDNYKFLGLLGCKKQKFTYFDYETGTFTLEQDDLSDIIGLSEHHLVDKSDPEDGLSYDSLGRSNAYHEKFIGSVHSTFETRINDLVKMWITVDGDLSLKLGDIVRVLFPQGFESGKLFSYQYAGYWLVERISYHFDDSFRMSLLLTRNGVELETKTSLVPATFIKR
jgi:hypothetical protein